jgi:ABC-type polysaccharide/polyol phosphate export permease
LTSLFGIGIVRFLKSFSGGYKLAASDVALRSETLKVTGGKNSTGWALAWADLIDAINGWEFWGTLGWNDIKQRYRRSFIGPFWLTITQAIMVVSLGVLYSFLFKVPVSEYLPYLTLGLLLWGFISSLISEGCTAFVTYESFLKQLSVPKSSFILRLIWRNLLMLAHHMVIYIPVVLIFSVPVKLTALSAIVGLAVICITGFWVALFLGMVCARFRDITPLVSSLLQVAFFVSPIMWKKDGMGEAVEILAALNPLYYFLEIVRAPLLGQPINYNMWLISLSITAVGLVLTMACFARYRARITYWL